MNETKEYILKTAFNLFLQKSYKEVTMKDIVEKTRLSKGAFYHYFKSKEELFIEIVETFYLKKLGEVNYGLFSKNSFYEFYHDYVQHIINTFMDLKKNLNDTYDDDDVNYLTLAFDALNRFPNFRGKVKIHHKNEITAWVNAIKLARENGEIKSPMSDEHIARLFVYSNDGIGLHLIMEGRISKLHKEMLEMWDSLYEEIKA